MQFFIGLVALAVGISMVIKTDKYIEFLGRNDWAEQKLGQGGTWLFYKLIGVVICLLGILGVTGLLTGFMGGALGAIFGPRQSL